MDNTPKKRLLFLIPSLTNGGAERVMTTIANNLCKDCDVRIATFTDSKIFYKLDERVEVVSLGQNVNRNNKLTYMWTAGKGGIVLIFKLIAQILKYKPHSVLSFLQATNLFSVCLKMIGVIRCPLVVSERCDPTVRGKFDKWFERNFYLFATTVVCQGEAVTKFFKEKHRKKLAVIPNPISADAIPERYTGERKKTIVGIGRLENQKNFQMLIRAFSRLDERFKDFTLEIYGGGNKENELNALIEELGLKDRAFLMGVKPNVMHHVKDRALYVMSSNYEGFPNALAEAMATGLPVISTDFSTGVAKDIVKEQNGIVIPVGDEDALVSAMTEILSDESKWESMSIENRKLLDTLSEENVIKMWKDALKIN